MRKLQILLMMIFIPALLTGCSDEKSSPVSPEPPGSTAETTWDAAGGFWRTTVDASSYTDITRFSFTDVDTTGSGAPKVMADVWDIAFRRDLILLNGGQSTDNSGDVEGADLGAVDFSTVTATDTTGAEWVQDAIEHQIDNWYAYNPVTHSITYNRNVYTIKDATGEHYVKFQVDSVVGGGQPPSMGTVYLKYFYQPTANNSDLSGSPVETSFLAGTSPVYFDFSSGGLVTPSDPANSLAWDLSFFSYEIAQNNGPNGIGTGGAFYAYGELTDPTDLDEVTSGEFSDDPQILTPYFPDYISSALDGWYSYNGLTHVLTSHEYVYLIRTEDRVYKMMIENWYKNINGVATSGHFTFVWNEL